jgi:hypothetical protein
VATVNRRTDINFNRCVDRFPNGRKFLSFKDRFVDDDDLVEFIVVLETDNTTTYISDPGAPLINADWDEAVRIDDEGDFDFIEFLTAPGLNEFNLAMWWTWTQRRRMVKMINDADTASWSPNEKRKGISGALLSAGVPPTEAETIGNDNITVPDMRAVKFDALGLTLIPPFWRALLRDL